MPRTHQRFTPDQQIDRVLSGSTPVIQDPRGYYQTEQEQNFASLERAWQYVLQHPANDLGRSASTAGSPHARTQSRLKDVSRLCVGKKKRASRSDLLAAVLVSILLVRSMAFVLNPSQRARTVGSPILARDIADWHHCVRLVRHGHAGRWFSPYRLIAAEYTCTHGGVQI
jgi:hypothetical protein